MDLSGRASHLLANHIEKLYQYQDEFISNLELSCNLMVETLLQDGKVFTCGNGLAGNLSKTLTLSLLDQFEHERPGLPSINLDMDSCSVTAMAQDNRFADTYSKPLRALGSSKDILVVFSTQGNCNNLIQAIQAAHDKEMKVVAIVGPESTNIGSITLSEDIYIPMNCQEKSAYLQSATLFTSILLDLIDSTIFGSHH